MSAHASKNEDLKRFIHWYVRPFNRLKRIPNADGALLALSMGCTLCERYFRIKSHTINKHWKTKPFLKKAAKGYDCDEQLFSTFWSLFRHGIQHQGSPKKSFKDGKKTIRFKWVIGDMTSHRPAYIIIDGVRKIGVNPWRFTRFMLKKFLKDDKALKKAISHGFGRLLEMPNTIRSEEVNFKGKTKVGW